MNVTELPTIARFFVDALEVFVFESRALAGHAAAQGVARELAARQQSQGRVNIVFAAAPSQNEFLAGLVADQEIDWSQSRRVPHGRIPRGSAPTIRSRSVATSRSISSGSSG